ncbi:serine/threonine-protein kinase [Polyangium mundeleinium]|uniref:Serine/threonine-protein kinase n=1 Tax=Polyangium mundeleinium TaxID=2995306 RepID=A0ABT5ER94_9BACT|nr:serine/threonine-protein kinase [Polyangium mundeleinium]MDC0744345.1 serine/threonine-protein kinase [Polyangium mundeleinium]
MTGSLESYVRVGNVIADKYVVERILGRGGMGIIIAARHTGLHERRAIKFMLPHVLSDGTAVERFRREARAASRIKSEHAVRVHDIDRLANGAFYIVMEYLEGQDLKAVEKARGPLPFREACDYVLQACEAIQEAHDAGIVHRDLKTANLFLTTGPRGEPWIKVLDFGIAKLVNEAEGKRMDITETKLALGTPAFMAPEQMKSSRHIDARADIWSLGVILYRLTTGVLPFDAPSINLMALRILSPGPAPAPSTHNAELPPLFDFIIKKCLEKDPERRLRSVAQLSTLLRVLVESKPAALDEEGNEGEDLTLDMTTRKRPAPSARGRTPVQAQPRRETLAPKLGDSWKAMPFVSSVEPDISVEWESAGSNLGDSCKSVPFTSSVEIEIPIEWESAGAKLCDSWKSIPFMNSVEMEIPVEWDLPERSGEEVTTRQTRR